MKSIVSVNTEIRLGFWPCLFRELGTNVLQSLLNALYDKTLSRRGLARAQNAQNFWDPNPFVLGSKKGVRIPPACDITVNPLDPDRLGPTNPAKSLVKRQRAICSTVLVSSLTKLGRPILLIFT